MSRAGQNVLSGALGALLALLVALDGPWWLALVLGPVLGIVGAIAVTVWCGPSTDELAAHERARAALARAARVVS